MALSPVIIQNFMSNAQTSEPLTRIPLDKPGYNENWLQDLIHNHPALVPSGEVEAAFDGIVPVVRELPLPSGFLDNLYITPSGYPVLVEVKLWKNQEARRKVLAQILEYAKDFAHLSASWLKGFLQSISDLPIETQVGKNGDTLMLKSATDITLMYINPPSVAFWGYTDRFKKSPEGMVASRKILDRFASLASGTIKVFPAGGMDVRLNDQAVPLRALHGKENELKQALRAAVEELDMLEAA